MILWGLVEVKWHFGRYCCLHHLQILSWRSRFLQNTGTLLSDYMESHSKKIS
jgi:hypothetical protein